MVQGQIARLDWRAPLEKQNSFRYSARCSRAFSDEVDTGSSKKMRPNQRARAPVPFHRVEKCSRTIVYAFCCGTCGHQCKTTAHSTIANGNSDPFNAAPEKMPGPRPGHHFCVSNARLNLVVDRPPHRRCRFKPPRPLPPPQLQPRLQLPLRPRDAPWRSWRARR